MRRCDHGARHDDYCVYCDIQERDKEIDRLTARNAELEVKNTFWACKNHAGNNTLRCAICDEKRIAELEVAAAYLSSEVEVYVSHDARVALDLSRAKQEIERLTDTRLQVCKHLFISGSSEGMNKVYCGSCKNEYMIPSKAFAGVKEKNKERKRRIKAEKALAKLQEKDDE